MAQKRKQALSYGRAGLGALVIGGENNDDFDLIEYTYRQDTYETLLVTASFFVSGTEATFPVNVSALNNLKHNSGDLGITGDTNVTFVNLTTAVSSNDLTVTDAAANGFFLATHIGLSIDIDGVGSFQIKSFTSTDEVVCQLPPELTAPTPSTGQAGRIGQDVLRCHDASATEGYFGRTSLQEAIGDPGNSKLRRKYVFTVRFETPATDAANDPGGRRTSRFNISETDGQVKSGTFQGSYTPTNIDATTSTTARANFEANAETWAAGVITTIGGTWEILTRVYSEPDENGTLEFQLSYRELNFPDTASGTDSALIRSAFTTFSRASSWQHGIPGTRPSVVNVGYTSSLPKDGTTWSQIPTRWKALIKGHLLASVRTAFGGSSVVLNENFTIFPHASKMQARMSVFIRDAGSDIISFQKIIQYGLDPRKETRDRNDGVIHSYTEFSNGPMITANVITEVLRVGSPVDSGSVILDGPQSSSADVVNSSNTNVWQTPGEPPFPPSLVGSAKWNPRPARVRHSPEFWGADIDGRSQRIETTRSVYVVTWLWGNIEDELLVSSSGGALGGKPPVGSPGGAKIIKKNPQIPFFGI